MVFGTDSKAIQYLQTFAARERFNFATLYPASGDTRLIFETKQNTGF